MTLLGILFGSFMLGFTGAVMPGPMLTATVSRSARGGFWVGPLIVAGHGVLELAVVLGVYYGLAGVLQLDAVRGSIAVFGGVLLVILGVSSVRQAPNLSLKAESAHQASKTGSLAVGALTSLANPYWSLWWAVTGLAAIMAALSEAGPTGAVVFYAGHISSDLVWYSIVAFLVSRATAAGSERGWISERFYRGLIAVCGIVLIGFGLLFLVFGAIWLAPSFQGLFSQTSQAI